MPQKRVSLAAMFALCIAPAAHAAAPAITAAETSVRLGLTAGYGQYQENTQPQGRESGALLGGTFGISALTGSGLAGGVPDLYANAEYDFSAGLFTYRGNRQGPDEQHYQAADNAYYNTVIVRLGIGRPVYQNTEVIPYLAGGYQNWYRNIGGFSGIGAYYQAGLVGGGLRFDISASPLLVLSASAEGLAVIGGRVSAPSENFSGSFGASAEERVGLDADYRLSSAWHAYAGLGLTHYNYSGSKPDTSGGYEASSGTLQLNSMFGVAYGF